MRVGSDATGGSSSSGVSGCESFPACLPRARIRSRLSCPVHSPRPCSRAISCASRPPSPRKSRSRRCRIHRRSGRGRRSSVRLGGCLWGRTFSSGRWLRSESWEDCWKCSHPSRCQLHEAKSHRSSSKLDPDRPCRCLMTVVVEVEREGARVGHSVCGQHS